MSQPSSSRNGRRVRLIAIHTAEGARTVESLDAYFTRTKTGSSHAGADDNRLVEGWVPYDRAAWTLRSGNPVSDNLELCAFAAWSRAEWLRHDDMLTYAAQWIAQRCRARDIPCVKISAADVRAGKSGVIGHIDWTNGMRDGTHWDPGPNFPWDIVMSRAQTLLSGNTIAKKDGFLVALNDTQQIEVHGFGRETTETVRRLELTLAAIAEALYLHKPEGDRWPGYGLDGVNNNVVGLYGILSAISGKVDTPAEVDVEELGKVIADAIPEAYASQVIDELAKRIGDDK